MTKIRGMKGALRILLGALLGFGAAPRSELRAASPSLEVVGIEANQLRIRLQALDGDLYALESSTNLVSWRQSATIQTTNGTAIYSYGAIENTGKLFIRAHQIVRPPVTTLHPQVSDLYSVHSLITPDGDTIELTTPSLQHVRFTIPPGCVQDAREITVSVVTNVVGLPFSGGAFGVVRLDPEDLLLSGAASLEFSIPARPPSTHVASFSSNNDGTGFRLVPDIIETNDFVLIPVTRFATYGSGFASRHDIQSIVGSGGSADPENGVERALAAVPCDVSAADDGSLALDTYAPSTLECFSELVARAIHAKTELTDLKFCAIDTPLAAALNEARANEVDERTVLMGQLPAICAFMTNVVAPYWQEAWFNCAMGEMLVQFTTGIQRQFQLFGIPLPSCGFLEDNFDNICISLKECLQEIDTCCQRGNRSWKKLEEIIGVVDAAYLSGNTTCFPNGLEDELVKPVLGSCLSNAWVGTLTVRRFGNTNYVNNISDSASLEFDHSETIAYQGAVYASQEYPPIPGFGIPINLTVTGKAGTRSIIKI